MVSPKNIQIIDYNYPLPDERIAKFPKAERDQSKLLVYNRGEISDDTFCNITDHLPKGEMMVFNNTRVIQARIYFHKTTGALIEVFLLEPAMPTDYELMFQTRGRCSWVCMVGNLKKWKEGRLVREIKVGDKTINLSVERKQEVHTGHWIDFEWDDETVSFAEIIDACGELPIPPYLNRKTEESDKTTYQTVTLHVGAGTFKPVKAERIEGHEMHTEFVSVRKHTIERLLAHEGRCIAVGTTSVRTLESLYYMGVKLILNADLTEEQLHVNQWEPYEGEVAEKAKTVSSVESLNALLAWYDRNDVTVLHSSTQIIIAPGYSYHIVKALVTNFHQPQSTLLLLVSALIGEDWHKVYDYALSHDFRFLSYGDSSLLMPK